MSEEKNNNPDEGVYIKHEIKADPSQSLVRIDKFLMDKLENATRTKIQEAAKLGNILVNKIAVKSNYKVKPHDLIQVTVDEPIQ